MCPPKKKPIAIDRAPSHWFAKRSLAVQISPIVEVADCCAVGKTRSSHDVLERSVVEVDRRLATSVFVDVIPGLPTDVVVLRGGVPYVGDVSVVEGDGKNGAKGQAALVRKSKWGAIRRLADLPGG